MSAPQPVTPDLETLVALFYDDGSELAKFTEVSAEDLPPISRRLLAHEHHMTVTVEEYHNSKVDVKVLDTLITETHYAREILLVRQSDGAVVQYGIMRVNLSYLDEPVRREIESQQTPLGRILINHGVLRQVHLFSLWEIEPAGRMRDVLEIPNAEQVPVVYGRTAMISCNGEPAIELLEVVTEI